MQDPLYQADSYQQQVDTKVLQRDGQGVVLTDSLFYAQGGGQPGDSGQLLWSGGDARVIDTRRNENGDITLLLAEDATPPEPGTPVTATIDWPRRHRLMRMHTCLHLLSCVLPYPVTGGQVNDGTGRLDFDLADAPDKETVEQQLNQLIQADHPVSARWIDEAQLDAQPELVKTLSVQPPRGAGRIRLIDIPGVDLQPCGGTHVARTGEIGPVRIRKIEKKGKQNRRVKLEFAD
jgi:misacylated tRNA(Ala) deacylase